MFESIQEEQKDNSQLLIDKNLSQVIEDSLIHAEQAVDKVEKEQVEIEGNEGVIGIDYDERSELEIALEMSRQEMYMPKAREQEMKSKI